MRSRPFCMPSKVSLTELLHTLAPDSFAVFPNSNSLEVKQLLVTLNIHIHGEVWRSENVLVE